MSYIARLGLILALITAVAAGALAYTNQLTAEQILLQVEKAKQDALLEVLPGAVGFDSQADLLAEAQAGDEALRDVQEMYVGRGAGGPVGTAYLVTVSGYGGPVVIVAGVNNEGAITGMKIVSASSETPGLGSKIKEAWFQNQFKGKTAGAPLQLVKTPALGQDQVQAVAAATISSSAVVRAINAATAVYRTQIAGGDPRLGRIKQEALQEIFPAADTFEAEPERLADAVAADPALAAATDLWTVKRGGEVLGTGVAASGRGYGGPIVAVVGFDPAGKIAAVRFVDMPGESTGVGTLIAEASFASQFAGRPARVLEVVRTAAGPDRIQAVSGATVSSAGAVAAVNNAIDLYNRLGRP
ncbi:MAG: RnfABCDGE type electron transport complex subunit G [Bacillota bacterium]|nr:RnfABCDGE type electron transport complex subunit G [Bacillota bacterium]